MYMRYFFMYLIIIFGMLLSACDLAIDSNAMSESHVMKIRVGLAMQPTSALLIIADEKNYFKEQGLDVYIKKYPSGKRALYQGLLKGDVDMVTLNESPFVMAAFKHDSLRAISGIFIDDNTNSIVARRDHGIHLPADLSGKKIATQKASAVHYFMHQFLVENDIDLEQIDIFFYKSEQLVEKLISGEIDAFSMREPYVSRARESLKDKVIVFEERGIYTQIGLLVSTEEYINKNSIITKRFLKALSQAEQFIKNDRSTATRMIASYLGADYEGFAVSFNQAEVKLKFDQLYIAISEDIARWAKKKNLVPNDQDIPNYLEKVSIASLREVSPDAVSLIVD